MAGPVQPEDRSDSPHPDPDRIELLERRLVDAVTGKVRDSLFKLYAAIGSAVLAVIAFAGFNVVTSMNERAVEAAREFAEEQVSPIAEEAQQQLTALSVNLRVFDELQKRTQATLDQLTATLANFEPQAQKLDQISASVDDLEVRRRELDARLEAFSGLVDPLEGVTSNMAELTRRVEELRQALNTLSTKVGEPQSAADAAALSGDLSALITASRDVQTAVQNVQESERQTTVYFQHFRMTEEQVYALTKSLRSGRFTVPGDEEQPMSEKGRFEILFYWPEDRAEAERLAGNTQTALAEQGISAPVTVRDYTGWTKAKPKPGVLELWIGLPAVASAQ